jgi:hypothetical protein
MAMFNKLLLILALALGNTNSWSSLVEPLVVIDCDDDVTGYISSGETDEYMLSANNGDLVWIRVFSTDIALNPRVQVFSPGNLLMGTWQASATGFVEIPNFALSQGSGQYRITVSDGVGNQAGGYSISVQIYNKTSCAELVTCTEESSDSYYYSAGVDAFYLPASANDRLRVRMYFSSPADWRVEVRRPDGTVYSTFQLNGTGLIDEVIPLSQGNWFFYVYDEGGDEGNTVHNYNYSFQLLEKTTCADQVTCSEESSDSYYYSAGVNAYYIAASAGDQLRLRLFFSTPANWRVEVRWPNGSLYNIFELDGAGLIDEIIPLSQGNWFFYVYDEGGDEGNTTHNYNYSFQLLGKTTCADQVACSENSADSYYYSAAINTYYLAASNNDLLRLRIFFTTPANWRVEVRRPDNTVDTIFAINGSGFLNEILPLSQGNWFFYVYDEGGDEGNTTHNYNYSFQLLGKTTCADQVACTEESLGSYYYGAAENAYYLSAGANDQLRLRMCFITSANWRIEVRRPDGTVFHTYALDGSGIIDEIIPLSQGNWFFYVYDEGGDEGNISQSYNYAFQLLGKTSCADQVTCTEDGYDSFYYSSSMNAYYIPSANGDKLRMQHYFNTSNNWRVELRRPDGSLDTLLTHDGIGLLSAERLLTGGNWFVYVYAASGDCVSTSHSYYYAFQLIKSTCASSINCGGSTNGSFFFEAEMDAYSFYAEACDTAHIQVTIPDPSLHISIRLYDPTGNLLASQIGTTDAGSLTLSMPLNQYGRHFIIINETEGDNDGNYSMSLNCTSPALAVAPATINVNALSGIHTFAVVSDCPEWLLSEQVPWMALNTNAGANNGDVSFLIEANPNSTPRSTQVMVAGCCDSIFVNVTQSGAMLNVAPQSINLGYAEGTTSFDVTSTCGSWTITSNAPWINSIMPSSGGFGSQTVAVSYQANTSASPRTAILTLSGCGITKTITLTQEGVFLNASPMSMNVPAGGGSQSVSVGSNCTSWTITASESWISPPIANGSGSQTISFTFSPNTGATSRTATINLSGCGIEKIINVAQANATMTLNPTVINVPASGGSQSVSVNGNCPVWTITASHDWVTPLVINGSYSESLTYIIDPNPGVTPRSATLILSGCGNPIVAQINQAGQNPTLSVTPTQISVSHQGGTTSIQVNGSCNNWELSTNAGWITTISPDNGNSPEMVTISYAANTSANSRVATITLSGCDYTYSIQIAQAGVPGSILITGDPVICPGETTSLCAPISDDYLWSTGQTDRCIVVGTPNTYSVTVINSAGSQTGSIDVVLEQNPIQPVIVQQQDFLWADGVASYWQWYINGVVIAGAIGQSYFPTQPGAYTVVAFSQHLCQSQSSAPFVVVGVDDLADKKQLAVAPNPAVESFDVFFPEAIPGGRLAIINSAGMVCRKLALGNELKITVGRENLPGGLYFLRWTAPDGGLLAVSRVVLLR